MPWKQVSGCGASGCAERATGRSKYCEEHEVLYKRERNNRKEQLRHEPSKKFYQSGAWRHIRQAQLAEEPICRDCGRLAEMVDHVVPIRKGGDMYDRANMQSLCNHCHNKKRGRESAPYKFIPKP